MTVSVMVLAVPRIICDPPLCYRALHSAFSQFPCELIDVFSQQKNLYETGG